MEASRGSKTICLPFESEEDYLACVTDAADFRGKLLECYCRHPELFPRRFADGFILRGAYRSVKQDLSIRRVELRSNGQVYQVRPSFVMPYMSAIG